MFVPRPGDTWAFTIIGDRLPLGAMIALIYFGVVRSYPMLGMTMLVVVLALAVWTSPNRWGAGIALHYLSRVYGPIPRIPSRRCLRVALNDRVRRDVERSLYVGQLFRAASRRS